YPFPRPRRPPRFPFFPYTTLFRSRVRYCAQARAVENQVYVALSGNVGNLPGVENMDVQYSQSCILTPCDFPFARDGIAADTSPRSEEHTSELQSRENLVCRLLLEK